MAKPGKKKKSCEKYKQEHHFEDNKLKKQIRNEKRIEKFRKRREAKENGDLVIEKESVYHEPNENSTQARHTEYSRLRSIFAKLHNVVMKEKMELAKIENEILRIEKEKYSEYLNS